MSYATPTDLLERFEHDLVAQRAAPEGVRVTGPLFLLTVLAGNRDEYSGEEIAAADAALARATNALLDATGLIDSYLTSSFTLPLLPVPRSIKRLCCDIARYYLWGDAAAKDGVEERDFKAALKMLEGIRRGDVNLGVQPDSPRAPDRVAGEVLAGDERVFTRRTLRGL